MQDEVSKHTRKIYQAMTNPEKSFWKKVREVTIEIFIIVFAVTLSIWLHNWSDHREEQKQTDEFLAGLKVDLAKDVDQLEENRKIFLEEESYFKFLEDIILKKTVDTINEHRISGHFNYQTRETHFNVARYDGFKSSAKIGTIENDSLKQAILAYYQQTIPGINDGEASVNGLQTKLMDAQFDRDDKMTIREFAKTQKALGYLDLNMQNLGPAVGEYVKAEAEARKIISMIDQYLKARK